MRLSIVDGMVRLEGRASRTLLEGVLALEACMSSMHGFQHAEEQCRKLCNPE